MTQGTGGTPTAQPPVYISFSAEISPQTTESLIALCSNLANQKVEHVYLILSTPGGSVMHGLNLYNVLKGMPFRLTTHNAGNVDSIGNVIFLAGKERYACPRSTFMFHGVGFDFTGQIRLEEKILKEKYDSLIADQKRIAAVISEQTKLSVEDVSTFFREGQTKDAAFAVGCGIVHEIRDLNLPLGGPIQALVFQR